jgi:YVTN family beta-propeller protein
MDSCDAVRSGLSTTGLLIMAIALAMVLSGLGNSILTSELTPHPQVGESGNPTQAGIHLPLGKPVPACTNCVIANVSAGDSPQNSTFDYYNGEVFVTNGGSGGPYTQSNITVIDGRTQSPVSSIPVGLNALGIAFDSQNGYVYVANYWSDNVTVINGLTDTAIATVGTGSMTNPDGVAFDTDNGCIYVADSSSNNVTVVDGTIAGTSIPVGTDPQWIGFDSLNGYLYVANAGSENLTVIDGASNSTVGSIAMAGEPGGAAVDSLNGNIYVTSPSSFDISVFNGTTDLPTAYIPVGLSFDAIVYDSGNGYLYATNSSSNRLSAINGATDEVVGSLTVGANPLGLSYDSSSGHIYVANSGANTVSIVSVYPTSIPSIAYLTDLPSTTDVGRATIFNTSVAGGAMPYIYSYSGLPPSCVSSDSPVLNCTPTEAGTFTVHVSVTDSGGWPLSATVSLNVNSPPYVSTFDATPSIMDLGNSTSLALTVSDGTPPYDYSYAGLPGGCASYDSATLLCNPDVTGRFNIRAFVNDSLHVSTSTITSILVNPSLSVSSFTATSGSIDLGGFTALRVLASGGAKPYTYEYTGLPAPCTTSNSPTLICAPSALGSFTVRVFVNDSVGASIAMTLRLNVNPTVSLSSFSASPNTVDIGNSTVLSVSVSGGTAPYTYTYTGLPGGCQSYNTPTLLCTPTQTGTFNPNVFVNDSAGDAISGAVALIISPALLSAVLTATANPIDLGSSTVLTTSFSGGTSPYSYTYTGLPSGCVTADLSTLTCGPGETGQFAVRVFVNDSADISVTASIGLIVNPPLSIASYTISSSSIDLGSAITLTVLPSGGTHPYTFEYEGLPGGCTSYNSSTILCNPNATGKFSVRAFLNDSAGMSVNSTRELSVSASILISTFTASPDVIDLGSFVLFTVSVSGGTTPLLFVYNGLPGGCYTTDQSSYGCQPTVQGTYDVRITVNDSVGMSSNASVTLTVNTAPSISSFASSAATAYFGQLVYLNVSTSGGTAPFSYTYKDLPRGCATYSSASLSCTPISSGTFNVRVYVNDTEGRSASTTTELTVISPVVPRSVTVTPGTAWISLDKTAEFTAGLTCTGPCPSGAVYSWTLSRTDMGSLDNATRSSVTFTARTTPGTVGLFVNVTLNGSIAQGNASIAIYETVPVLTSLELSPSSPTLSEGQTVAFEAFMSCSTGTCPPEVSYHWSLNNTLGTIIHTSGTYATFVSGNRTGSIALIVTATLNGKTMNATAMITIALGSSGALTFLGLPGDWGYGILAAIFAAVVVVLILILLLRRREGDTTPGEGEERPYRPAARVAIPRETPAGYYSEMTIPKHLVGEMNEKDAYGTFEAAPEFITGTHKQEAGHSAYEPFSITITPGGIQVETLTGPTAVKTPVLPSGAAAPAKVSEKDAYAVLATLGNRPQGLDGIKQDVHLSDTQLTALLNAFTKGKLIARGQSGTKGTVYALTPLGRKLGHRFTGQGKTGGEDAKEAPPRGPSESKDSQPLTEPPKSTKTEETPKAPATSTDKQGGTVDSSDQAKSTSPQAAPQAESASKGIVLERTLGEERNEENPFGSDIKPEDINPNVKHLDPKLLQPMELRVTQDSGKETSDITHPETVDDKTKELMERAKRSRMKPKNRFGFMRAKKPEEEEQDKEH